MVKGLLGIVLIPLLLFQCLANAYSGRQRVMAQVVVPVAQLGVQDGVRGFWLQPSPALATASIGGHEPVDGISSCLFQIR